jgi:hypothetical protein
MAEVAAKKPSEQKASDQKTNDAGTVAHWNAGGPSSYWDPFGQAPSEFFSNPFSIMRRFSEEMDRNFGRFFGHESSERVWSPAIEVIVAILSTEQLAPKTARRIYWDSRFA